MTRPLLYSAFAEVDDVYDPPGEIRVVLGDERLPDRVSFGGWGEEDAALAAAGWERVEEWTGWSRGKVAAVRERTRNG